MKIENRKIVMKHIERIEWLEEQKKAWEVCTDYAEERIIGLSPDLGRVPLRMSGVNFESIKSQSISYYEEEIAKLIKELEEL